MFGLEISPGSNKAIVARAIVGSCSLRDRVWMEEAPNLLVALVGLFQ